jgi:hypothetical protein
MAACSLVEIWRPRPEWYALTKSQKQDLLGKGAAVIESVTKKGAKLVGIHRCRALSEGGWDVFAYWEMPSIDLAVELSERIEQQLDWSRYFEQVNYVGKTISTEEYFAGLLTAGDAK